MGGLLLDTKDGAFTLRNVLATPGWLAVEDSLGRSLVFSLKTGAEAGSPFGHLGAISEQAGCLVVERTSNDLSLYNLSTMQLERELSFNHWVSDVQFSRDGKKLGVLTSDQAFYSADVAAATLAVHTPTQ